MELKTNPWEEPPHLTHCQNPPWEAPGAEDPFPCTAQRKTPLEQAHTGLLEDTEPLCKPPCPGSHLCTAPEHTQNLPAWAKKASDKTARAQSCCL